MTNVERKGGVIQLVGASLAIGCLARGVPNNSGEVCCYRLCFGLIFLPLAGS